MEGTSAVTEPFIIPAAQLRELADSRKKIHEDARAALLLAALAIETLQDQVTKANSLAILEIEAADRSLNRALTAHAALAKVEALCDYGDKFGDTGVSMAQLRAALGGRAATPAPAEDWPCIADGCGCDPQRMQRPWCQREARSLDHGRGGER